MVAGSLQMRRTATVAAWIIAVLTMIAAAWVLHNTFAATAENNALTRWALTLAGVWAVGGLAICALAPRPKSLRARPRPRTAALMIAICAVGIAGVCFVGGWLMLLFPPTEAAVRANLTAANSAAPLAVLGVALIAGAAEECFFRLGLANLTTGWVRWVVPNLLYLGVTAASGNAVLTLAAPLLGLVATAAREFTGAWPAPLIVHATWSVTMVWVFPITVHSWGQ